MNRILDPGPSSGPRATLAERVVLHKGAVESLSRNVCLYSYLRPIPCRAPTDYKVIPSGNRG